MQSRLALDLLLFCSACLRPMRIGRCANVLHFTHQSNVLGVICQGFLDDSAK